MMQKALLNGDCAYFESNNGQFYIKIHIIGDITIFVYIPIM